MPEAEKPTKTQVNPKLHRKVVNAYKYISKDDKILEFCYDDPTTGEMAGFLNKLGERKSHTVLTDTPERFQAIKEEAKAEYELATETSQAFTALVVSKRSAKNIASLQTYLDSVKEAPKLVIWESPNAELDNTENQNLHKRCVALGMKPTMFGYENVYHSKDMGEPQYIPNPPPPRFSQMAIAIAVIVVIALLSWAAGSYFFKKAATSLKGLRQ
jgi:hypothetical protein